MNPKIKIIEMKEQKKKIVDDELAQANRFDWKL